MYRDVSIEKRRVWTVEPRLCSVSGLMAIPTPESGWSRFWKSETPWDLVSAGAGLGTGGGAAYRFFSADPAIDPNALTWGWIVAAGVLVAGLSQLVKAVRRWKLDAAKDSPHDLAGCLHTVNAILCSVGAIPRALVFDPPFTFPMGSRLVQALDYAGDQRKKNTKGRRRSVNVGAIGKAFRERAAICAHRVNENHDDFVNLMVTIYGYSEDQARALEPSTMSWMAVPLKSTSGDVEGVLYCDCKVRDFFTEDRQAVVIFAAIGIAIS